MSSLKLKAFVGGGVKHHEKNMWLVSTIMWRVSFPGLPDFRRRVKTLPVINRLLFDLDRDVKINRRLLWTRSTI